MTTPSPLAPRLLKGAIIAIDLTHGKQETTIAFQYNPQTVQRSLKPRLPGESQGQRSQAVRFAGAPEETVSLEVIIDATDDLANTKSPTHRAAVSEGIYPRLSALEMLLYPRSSEVVDNDKLLQQGKIEVGSGYDAPLTLFVWGQKRALPVVLVSYSVTEEAFDANLNPIRARVKLEMRALSYSDLDPGHKGYQLFLAYQTSKERMAQRGVTDNAKGVTGVDTGRFR